MLLGLGRGSLLGLLLILGCDTQVGTEYSGETLLTLRGQVQVSPDSPADLVPALALVHPLGDYISLVDGEVDGSFPANFRFRVTKPPPDSTIIKSAIATGWLVLVPRQHPSTIELPQSSDGPIDCSDDGRCLARRTYCLKTGACLERTFDCAVEQPIELVAEAGDPTYDGDGHTYLEVACGLTQCFRAEAACGNSEACHRTFRRIPQSGDATFYLDGAALSCVKKSEQGDASVMAFTNYPFVTNLAVVYAVGPEAVPSALDLRRGYNAVQSMVDHVSGEAWVSFASCSLEAQIEANTRYLHDHGLGGDFRLSDEQTVAVAVLAGELERAECEPSPFWKVLDDPSAAPLVLDLRVGLENATSISGYRW